MLRKAINYEVAKKAPRVSLSSSITEESVIQSFKNGYLKGSLETFDLIISELSIQKPKPAKIIALIGELRNEQKN